ncbi:MAG: methyltransferase domain-containing protein [Isosphaeraceae bacterium]|nr:methyltransferase domain-containing protein [Isosphaeraceae bacterium]
MQPLDPSSTAPVSRGLSIAAFGRRDRRPELMDQPGLDEREHARALAGLRRINRLSRTVDALWGKIGRLLPDPSGEPLRVLDLACGGGDNAIALARRAHREGRSMVVEGCDMSAVAVACAQSSAARGDISARFFIHDVLRDPLPGVYDVVTCSLFLHHLDEGNAATLFRHMAAAARRLVLVDDLVRSRAGYLLAWFGCRLLSRSPVVHYDGPVSVAAAFRPAEAADLAARAGLRDVSITRHWPQRFLLAGSPR